MKTKVSRETIMEFLLRRYAAVSGLEALAEGEESQAFAVVADGQSLVVRINRDRAGFDMDRLAAERFAQLPVPTVIMIDALDGAWMCVSERAIGETLQALGVGAAQYGDAVLDVLDTMATADVSFVTGCGPFDAKGRGAFASWTDFVTAVEGLEDFVRRVSGRRYPDIRKLVHGDFGSNNVLVDRGMVTAVIDWSEAMVGDPLYDVANLFFWRTWLDCMEVQCLHIEAHHPQRIADDDLLTCYQLRIGLQVLTEARRNGDHRLAESAFARCREIAGK